jgi:hypothetical protein
MDEETVKLLTVGPHENVYRDRKRPELNAPERDDGMVFRFAV